MKKYVIAVLAVLFMFPSIASAQRIDLFAENEEDPPILLSKELRLAYAQYAMISAKTYAPFLADQVSAPQASSPAVNDPYYSSTGTWGQAYDDMWGLKRINIDDAWKLSTGYGATVAVIDSGITYDPFHADINDNLWINTAEFNGTAGVDDDGNGCMDDIYGTDFYTPENIDPYDFLGQGSHVSGIIAAEGNNNEGIVGVAYNAKIMTVKITSEPTIDTWKGNIVISAIRYAVDMGAKVLNYSFASQSFYNVKLGIDYAYSKGAIIVVAAGDDNDHIYSRSPAQFDNVITVGSIDQSGLRSSNSNYGPELDIVAPGEDILSLKSIDAEEDLDIAYNVPPGDANAKYYRMSGTAMSTAFVSGVVALMVSQDPEITFTEVYRRLRYSAYDLGAPGRDDYYGWGLLNASKALSYDWHDPSGNIKTWWVADPDPVIEGDVVRYDYEDSSSGTLVSKTFDNANVEIINNATWDGKTHNLNSIIIPAGKTLIITGVAIVNSAGGIAGGGNLTVQNGTLTAKSIHAGTLTIGSGATVTIAPISGGPLAGSTIQAVNQESAAIIGINTNQGNLYGAGGIPVSPQIAGNTNNSVINGQNHPNG